MAGVFDEIHRAADCRKIAERYLKPSKKRGKYVCPGCGDDNLSATSSTWSCWTHECQRKSGADATGMVSLATGEIRSDAAKRLAGELGIGPMVARAKPVRSGQRPAIQPKPPKPEPYELESWREWMTGVVEQSHARLMDQSDDTSRRAWDYLTGERGLLPETIESARLGVALDWVSSDTALPGRRCSLPPGVIIPWFGPHGVAGANVRQFHVELSAKYIMATGSRRHWLYPGLIGWESWPGPVVIVEGEFDSLLANQELSGLLPVVTLGGAKCSPADTFDAVLLGQFSRLLIAADSDDAGDECRKMWFEFARRRAVPVDLPGGKDLTEAHAAGADLRSWLFEVCRGLGIDLHSLPGLVWELPLGTIRGRLLDDPRDAAESEAEAAAERAAMMHEGGHGGRS